MFHIYNNNAKAGIETRSAPTWRQNSSCRVCSIYVTVSQLAPFRILVSLGCLERPRIHGRPLQAISQRGRAPL